MLLSLGSFTFIKASLKSLVERMGCRGLSAFFAYRGVARAELFQFAGQRSSSRYFGDKQWRSLLFAEGRPLLDLDLKRWGGQRSLCPSCRQVLKL